MIYPYRWFHLTPERIIVLTAICITIAYSFLLTNPSSAETKTLQLQTIGTLAFFLAGYITAKMNSDNHPIGFLFTTLMITVVTFLFVILSIVTALAQSPIAIYGMIAYASAFLGTLYKQKYAQHHTAY